MKSVTIEIRNTVDEVTVNLDTAEEEIIELEDGSEKENYNQTGAWREKSI